MQRSLEMRPGTGCMPSVPSSLPLIKWRVSLVLFLGFLLTSSGNFPADAPDTVCKL